MKFMDKKWILVGLILLVLASGVSGIGCVSLNITHRQIVESNGVKLVFIKPESESCGGSQPYLENQGTKTATNLALRVLINGQELSNQQLATNVLFDKIELKAGEKVPLFGLEELHEAYGGASPVVIVTSEEGASTEAELSWSSGSSSADHFVFIYFVSGVILFAASCLLLILKKNKGLAFLLIFLSIGLIICWLLSISLAYQT